MSFSLHAAIVPTQIQMVDAVTGLIGKAEAYCVEAGVAPADLLARRLAPDMQPLSYQIKSVAVHSAGAIEGVRAGAFAPDNSVLPDSFAPLRDQLAAARAILAGIDPDEMAGWIGRDMMFVFGAHKIAFAADDFLLSFSQPNFYFHCSIAYALLRTEGLAIGKTDFMGRQRRKKA